MSRVAYESRLFVTSTATNLECASLSSNRPSFSMAICPFSVSICSPNASNRSSHSCPFIAFLLAYARVVRVLARCKLLMQAAQLVHDFFFLVAAVRQRHLALHQLALQLVRHRFRACWSVPCGIPTGNHGVLDGLQLLAGHFQFVFQSRVVCVPRLEFTRLLRGYAKLFLEVSSPLHDLPRFCEAALRSLGDSSRSHERSLGRMWMDCLGIPVQSLEERGSEGDGIDEKILVRCRFGFRQ